ncbi:hypothetical protein CR513_03884, partial [Mucuna pruriens]
MKYITLFYSTHLKWVLDFLLYYPFYKLHNYQKPIIWEEQSICHYASTPGSEEDVECAVCLCKIEDGEEIRVLRNCLDTWVALKIATCPLCRESVRPRSHINEVGAQVLFFEFCSIHTDEGDRWWLR